MATTILAVRAAAFTAMNSISRMAQSIGQHKTRGRVTARSWSSGLRLRNLFDPYRPELHYMRGPGPRWQQKYRESKQTARPQS
jgi:hypothetical protein